MEKYPSKVGSFFTFSRLTASNLLSQTQIQHSLVKQNTPNNFYYTYNQHSYIDPMTFTCSICSEFINSSNHWYLNNKHSYLNLVCTIAFFAKIRYSNMPSSKLYRQYSNFPSSIVQKSKSPKSKIVSNIHDQIWGPIQNMR